jgi:glycosyltransferase involved in cell wall biosynthesis
MEKKIGIFLGCEPYGGGTFQYNQSIIEAVAAFPQDKYKIVFCCTSELWLNYLKKYDYKVSLIRSTFFWGRVVWKLWRIFHLPISWWRRINHFFHPIAKGLYKEKCDLWIFPSQDGWSHLINVPTLVAIHDLMHRYERRFPEIADKRELKWRESHFSSICRFAKGILVDSKIGKEHVIDSYHVKPETIFVLPFVAPGYIFNRGVPKGFEERYALPKKFIFYPAQFWEHKNHKNLIRAIALLKRDLLDIKLVLVGSPKNAYNSVIHLVKELNVDENICFLGYVPDQDMPEIYRRARAMIMPTFCGPTNIPPLEGFASGCPVAVSNVYGMPEQVGDAALLFNPNSISEIAEIIRKLWVDDELCSKLKEKGLLKTEKWNQKHFGQRLLEIVEQVI